MIPILKPGVRFGFRDFSDHILFLMQLEASQV